MLKLTATTHAFLQPRLVSDTTQPVRSDSEIILEAAQLYFSPVLPSQSVSMLPDFSTDYADLLADTVKTGDLIGWHTAAPLCHWLTCDVKLSDWLDKSTGSFLSVSTLTPSWPPSSLLKLVIAINNTKNTNIVTSDLGLWLEEEDRSSSRCNRTHWHTHFLRFDEPVGALMMDDPG